MNLKRKKDKETLNRLNLIPILDSVFIFIFFLLMSAQFLKYSQINAEVPMLKDGVAPKKNNEKEKRKLIVSLNENNIVTIKEMPSKRTLIKLPLENKDELKTKYSQLMASEHEKFENFIKYSANKNVEYFHLIEVIDLITEQNIKNSFKQNKVMIMAEK
jgi:biopolymer transport protein ExbD